MKEDHKAGHRQQPARASLPKSPTLRTSTVCDSTKAGSAGGATDLRLLRLQWALRTRDMYTCTSTKCKVTSPSRPPKGPSTSTAHWLRSHCAGLQVPRKLGLRADVAKNQGFRQRHGPSSASASSTPSSTPHGATRRVRSGGRRITSTAAITAAPRRTPRRTARCTSSGASIRDRQPLRNQRPRRRGQGVHA